MKYYDLDIRISSQVEDHYAVDAESESMGQGDILRQPAGSAGGHAPDGSSKYGVEVEFVAKGIRSTLQ